MMLSCEDTSGEVRVFHAHTWWLLRVGRFVPIRSRMLNYGWGGP